MGETMSNADSDIQIKARPSQLDPDLCTFMVDRPVEAGGPYRFDNEKAAQGSPLPEQLFATSGVASVVIQDASVIVRKVPGADWPELMSAIGKRIREQLTSGEPVLSGESQDAGEPLTDAEMLERVRKLLDDEINPSLGGHGGSVSVEKVEDRVVHVRMEGGCQGCASASATMHHGVEVLLRREIPSIEAVVDVTDHASGVQPFY